MGKEYSMGEVLKKIQEINNIERVNQIVLGRRDMETTIKRLEKLIFALAEEIDKREV